MRIRNISNQSIPVRRTDTAGNIVETIVVSPGDSDVHEIWKDTIERNHGALIHVAPEGAYEGPTKRSLVEPTRDVPRNTGEPSSAVKHDDQPTGTAPHPGRPNPGEKTPEQLEEERKADEAKKRADEKGPGTRRREG
jgi:hypothetical protein